MSRRHRNACQAICAQIVQDYQSCNPPYKPAAILTPSLRNPNAFGKFEWNQEDSVEIEKEEEKLNFLCEFRSNFSSAGESVINQVNQVK